MNIRLLLNQTVTVKPLQGVIDGDTTYGEPVTYPARIDYDAKRVLGRNGLDVSGYATIYLQALVGENDLFVLPGDSVERTALQVRTLYRGDGSFGHCEVVV